MSLIKSRQLFSESEFPVAVDTVEDRTLIQKDLHRHEYFELLFVQKGSLINRFKGAEIHMKPGDLLIMKPFVLHVLDEDAKDLPRKAYCCSFLLQAVDSSIQALEDFNSSPSPNKYFFKPFMSLVQDDVPVVQLKLAPRHSKVLVRLFEQLRKTTHEHTERGNALTRCRFLDLLEFLADQYEGGHASTRAVHADLAASVSRHQAGLRKALNYIHDHYVEQIALENVAAMSGASETYFCRLFKHETGMTFLNYLNGLRIERACILLRDTSDNALEICYKVGFSDYTHFGRQFKKYVGLSPAAFREQNQRSNHETNSAGSVQVQQGIM